jgi:hypothetical protein
MKPRKKTQRKSQGALPGSSGFPKDPPFDDLRYPTKERMVAEAGKYLDALKPVRKQNWIIPTGDEGPHVYVEPRYAIMNDETAGELTAPAPASHLAESSIKADKPHKKSSRIPSDDQMQAANRRIHVISLAGKLQRDGGAKRGRDLHSEICKGLDDLKVPTPKGWPEKWTAAYPNYTRRIHPMFSKDLKGVSRSQRSKSYR